MASRMRQALERWAPPPEYLLNHVVNRIPLVGARMAAYAALGVRFEDRSTTTIMLHTEVWKPRRLEIGAGSIVGRDCLLDARGGLRIGRSVNITSGARFMSASHDIDDPLFAAGFETIVVEDRAWIALGATILGGVTIGEGAVVGAGAVVTQDVPPYWFVAGIPATRRRERPHHLEYDFAKTPYRPNWI